MMEIQQRMDKGFKVKSLFTANVTETDFADGFISDLQSDSAYHSSSFPAESEDSGPQVCDAGTDTGTEVGETDNSGNSSDLFLRKLPAV